MLAASSSVASSASAEHDHRLRSRKVRGFTEEHSHPRSSWSSPSRSREARGERRCARLWSGGSRARSLLASLERLVPHSRLRMRSLQWHLKLHWSPKSNPPSLPVPLSREVREDLSWWMVWDHLLKGV